MKSEVSDYELFKQFQAKQKEKISAPEEPYESKKKRLAEEQAAFVDNKKTSMMGP